MSKKCTSKNITTKTQTKVFIAYLLLTLPEFNALVDATDEGVVEGSVGEDITLSGSTREVEFDGEVGCCVRA